MKFRINKEKDKEIEKVFSCDVWDVNQYELNEYLKIKRLERRELKEK